MMIYTKAQKILLSRLMGLLIIMLLFFGNPLAPLFFIPMFYILKLHDSDAKNDILSKWAKGLCYGLLGLLGFIDSIGILTQINHISAAVYAATMGFIECIDQWFNLKHN